MKFLPGIKVIPNSSFISHNLQSTLTDPDTVDRILHKDFCDGFMTSPFSSPPLEKKWIITLPPTPQPYQASTVLSPSQIFQCITPAPPMQLTSSVSLAIVLGWLKQISPGHSRFCPSIWICFSLNCIQS